MRIYLITYRKIFFFKQLLSEVEISVKKLGLTDSLDFLNDNPNFSLS